MSISSLIMMKLTSQRGHWAHTCEPVTSYCEPDVSSQWPQIEASPQAHNDIIQWCHNMMSLWACGEASIWGHGELTPGSQYDVTGSQVWAHSDLAVMSITPLGYLFNYGCFVLSNFFFFVVFSGFMVYLWFILCLNIFCIIFYGLYWFNFVIVVFYIFVFIFLYISK